MTTEAKNITGVQANLENGSVIFCGNDGTDVFLKFTNAEGMVTPLRLSEEAAFATIKLLIRQFGDEGDELA